MPDGHDSPCRMMGADPAIVANKDRKALIDTIAARGALGW
jgi:hypothetical protein